MSSSAPKNSLLFFLFLSLSFTVCVPHARSEGGKIRNGCYARELQLLKMSFPKSNASSSSSPNLCRDKFGYASVLDFMRRSSVMCHFFLFPESPQDAATVVPSSDLLFLVPIGVNTADGGLGHRNQSEDESSHRDASPILDHLPGTGTDRRPETANDGVNNFTRIDDTNNTNQTSSSASSPSSSSSSSLTSMASKVTSSELRERRDKMLLRSGAAAMSVLAAAASAYSGDTLDPLDEEDFQLICRRLGVTDCARWQECMSESVACCRRQVEKGCEESSSARLQGSKCPMTWDGFSCWDETESETKVTQQCPEYVDATGLYVKSVKTCSENGTWFLIAGQEWTDYMDCYDKRDHVFGVHLNIVLNIMCIVFLVLAIWLFAYFRDLMRQERIRLHMHFFVSLILVSTFKVIWFALVHYDLLTTKYKETVVDQNPVWCRMISFMVNYLKGTNFTWMFCEAYHLHRLISDAFETPGSMSLLYVIGWFFPVLTTMSYAMARYYIDNSRCWTKNVGPYQWIIDAPMCLCLLLNLLFLLNILRTLLFQLQAHPNEPNAFRRGIKAGLMLVPLFGVQLLITIYRPDLDPKFGLIYEYFSFVILNSQGIFVSLIFCFLNGEVLTHMKRGLIGWCRGKKGNRSNAYMTNTRGSLLDLTTPNQDEDAGEKSISVLKSDQLNYRMIPMRNLHPNGLAA